MDEEESRAVKEGLDNDEYLAVFDILRKSDLSKQDIARIKKVSIELLDKLKQEMLNLENWSEKESTRDAIRTQIYDFLYDDKKGLPLESYEVEEISPITEELFKHIFRAYPRIPSPIYEEVA